MTVRENLLIGAEASRNSTFVLVFLAALKVIVGFYSGSAALIADGVHTSLDIFTSLAVWVGLKLSLKHSGEKFPYGYYKSENLVALFVSILILLSGLQLARQALATIKNPSGVELQGLALVTAIFSVFTIYALSRYKARIGKHIDSQALIADAMHSYTDVFSSLVVVVAIVGSMVGIPWLDSVGVLVISLMIFRLGIGIARDSALTLMDAWMDEDSVEGIRQTVANIPGVNNIEDIKLRKSGLVVFGEIEVEIEGEANLKRVEMLSKDIEKAVKKEVKNLEHLVINAKPMKMKVVKVAVPVMTQDGLHSKPTGHFGRAPYYIFVEMKNNEIKRWKIEENVSASLERKKGVKTAEFLKNKNTNVLIVREIGGGPFHVLHDSFVKILKMPDVVQDLEQLVCDIPELDVITEPTE
ncbi:MAG: cation diffusion facilitator family transporter [Methanosarcinaceae archaeon]|nr:cation diffusion facilitator family transporter [Methanosarcinaceae archaeon]